MHILSPRLRRPRSSRRQFRPDLRSLAMLASVLLAGCAGQTPTAQAPHDRVDRELVTHTLQIDIGEPAVMSLPQRKARVTEQLLFRVRYLDAQGNLIDSRDEYQTLPWAEKPISVVAGNFQTTLHTDADGHLQLNLLNDGFLDLDYQ